jgi:hypothetical protein
MLLVIYFVSYIFFFLLLSTVGMFSGTPYLEVITSDGWLIGYTMFFGWWLAIFPAREYYIKNEKYFERVF